MITEITARDLKTDSLITAYKDEDGEPIDHVTNPDKQLAHKALGDYGPLGVKVSNNDFLQ